MRTNELKDRVCLNLLEAASSRTGIIAAGPITKQPSTNPFRVVLVDLGDEFVVWNEYWQDTYNRNGQLVPANNSHYEAGDYFPPHKLAEATERFAERVKQNASTIRSIYRDVA